MDSLLPSSLESGLPHTHTDTHHLVKHAEYTNVSCPRSPLTGSPPSLQLFSYTGRNPWIKLSTSCSNPKRKAAFETHFASASVRPPRCPHVAPRRWSWHKPRGLSFPTSCFRPEDGPLKAPPEIIFLNMIPLKPEKGKPYMFQGPT